MTAPRETGGEVWLRISRALRDAVAVEREESTTERVYARLDGIAAKCASDVLALLATSRPVEVTEAAMDRAAMDALVDEITALRLERKGLVNEALRCTHNETVMQVLGIIGKHRTAALRAQPAGGTPEMWCEAPGEGGAPCAVQCRACELLENAAAPTLPPVGEREWFEYRYKSAGSSEWGAWLRFGTRRGRDGEADRMHGMGLAVETRDPRPSPAPSGEPVAWGLRDELGRINVARAHAEHLDDLERALASNGVATTRVPLYAAAPHPDGAA